MGVTITLKNSPSSLATKTDARRAFTEPGPSVTHSRHTATRLRKLGWGAALAVLLVTIALLRPWADLPATRQASHGTAHKKGEPDCVRVEPDAPIPSAAGAVVAEARRLACWLVEQFPQDPDAYETKARTEFSLGDAAEAMGAWERCLELEPRYVHAYHGLGLLHARIGEHGLAESRFRKAIELAPRSLEPRIELARALSAQAKDKEAIALLEQIVAQAPRAVECLVLLGKANLRENQARRARQCFEDALEIQPDNANALFGSVTACTRLGQRDQAAQHLAAFKRVRAQEQMDRYSARSQYDDVQAMRRQLAWCYTTAGEVCEGAGRLQDAERIWLRAVALAPDEQACRQRLARLYRFNPTTGLRPR